MRKFVLLDDRQVFGFRLIVVGIEAKAGESASGVTLPHGPGDRVDQLGRRRRREST